MSHTLAVRRGAATVRPWKTLASLGISENDLAAEPAEDEPAAAGPPIRRYEHCDHDR
ncbi:hypothetical protein [Streptomyces hiroshimensis]|uniref:Uncharacterized protein n=1 Tax=Streptomyces hiroshimensis TaxID=66424 RepID=A0ABQ2Z986_9ACTN|nr:hypothetical protein [Streptomyces hiroshimensis]GGY05441.1 hypothetical protein GCM10010324_60240 [Streptomyces hiroshimensis]